MKTLQISKFKAGCLSLLKNVNDTGESLGITLRGRMLAVIQPPTAVDLTQPESVAATLRRLRSLLEVDEEDLKLPPRLQPRASALDPLGDKRP